MGCKIISLTNFSDTFSDTKILHVIESSIFKITLNLRVSSSRISNNMKKKANETEKLLM